MGTIANWTNEVRAVAPGCTSSVYDQVVKAAIREFYRESGAWIETITDIDTAAAVSTLDLSYQAQIHLPAYDGYVHIIHYIKYDDTYLKVQHSLDESPTGDIPTQFYTLELGKVRLIPYPANTVSDIIEAKVSLIPIFTADDVPNDATGIWFDYILDGILGRLYTQPDKPYTNMVQGQYHLRRFRNSIAEARDAARRRNTKTENSWTFPAWA